jgi:threonine/homoserine efflux transporter RhtA
MAMNPPRDPAIGRYYLMVLARIMPVCGALFGLVILGRATQLPQQLIGLGIVLCALWVMATLPRALARRWRTPPAP